MAEAAKRIGQRGRRVTSVCGMGLNSPGSPNARLAHRVGRMRVRVGEWKSGESPRMADGWEGRAV